MGSKFGTDSRKKNRFLSSPKRPDRPWGPPSLLHTGWNEFISWG